MLAETDSRARPVSIVTHSAVAAVVEGHHLLRWNQIFLSSSTEVSHIKKLVVYLM